jgi:polyisoprenoid-binding protein YceI
VLAVVGYILLHGQAPEEVSLESAVQSAQSGTETTPADPPSDTSETTAAPAATIPVDLASGIGGEWVVDTSIGEFSFEDATASFVGFRIQEELASIGATEAVGRTPTVDGRLVIDGSTVIEATITADMTDIVTNNSRRDDRVQGALSTGEFPTATFTLSEPFDVSPGLIDGDPIAVTAVGDLTIAGVTNEVEFPLEAQAIGDIVIVVGSLEIDFADWGVRVPSAAAVVSAEDHGPIEMQLFFARA